MLEELLEKWRRGARGPLPQLKALQLLTALLLIEQEGPMGRRALARALLINDGIARGLLERLKEQRVAYVTDAGVKLSSEGKIKLRALLNHMSMGRVLPLSQTGIVPGKKAVGVHLVGRYKEGMTGIPQRDEAVKAGADGSIIIAAKKGKLVVPPDDRDTEDFAPEDGSRLRDLFKPAENDLIVIGFASDPRRALSGALAAAMSAASGGQEGMIAGRREFETEQHG